jgi:hypothetical protein
MGWTIGVSDGEGFARAVILGEVTLGNVRQVASEGLAIAMKHGMRRFLVDLRAMTSHVSTLQIYLMPKVLEVLGLGRDSRVALIIPSDPKRKDSFRFYQTVSANRGFTIGLFHEPDAARQWLTAGT